MSHGGKRPGAGRPKELPDGERVRLVVTVTPEQAAALDRYVERSELPSRSHGVRHWLDGID